MAEKNANTFTPLDRLTAPCSTRRLTALVVASFAGFPVISPEAHGSPPGYPEQEVFGFRLVSQERNGDGAYVSTFRLDGIGENGTNATPHIVYRAAARQSRAGARGTYTTPEFYRKQIGTGTSSFNIPSGRSEQIELWARIRRGDTFHYAQTLFAAFGQSGRGHEDAERLDSLPDWPTFRLSSAETFYRAQTGSELTFQIQPIPVEVSVFENQVPVARLPADGEGFYRYTPPHEVYLAKAGFSAKKDVLIVADLPDDKGRVSFYLPVFRAFYGQANLLGGLIVLSGSMAFSLALVWLRSKKFPWQ
ncbi:MAG: hypothetical protein LBJ76_07005 [Candidatus Accumulibacter sp.]|nr:hypothetical protein [Accumulibacter sp.]